MCQINVRLVKIRLFSLFFFLLHQFSGPHSSWDPSTPRRNGAHLLRMPPQLICQTTRSQVGVGKVAVCINYCHTDAASAATCMLLIALQAWNPSQAHPSRQMRREPTGSLLSLPTVKWRKPRPHSHLTRKEEDKLSPRPPKPHTYRQRTSDPDPPHRKPDTDHIS